MTTREYVLVADDDRGITDALALMLERQGRTTIVCSDLESAEAVLARFPITHLVSDVQFTGSFGFEGFHFISRIHSERPDCRIVLMSGGITPELRKAALAAGASAVLSKPFCTEELEAALDSAPAQPEEAEHELIRVASIDEMLQEGLLTTAFQPIVRSGPDGVTMGFEALTRIRGGWACGGPAELFDYAARQNRLAELNLAALRSALSLAGSLPPDTSLFVNIDPEVFLLPEFEAVLRQTAAQSGFPLSRVVLEITERSGFHEDADIRPLFDSLRQVGIRFALDDHGSAYSHLSMINVIRPSFFKISHTFGTAFDQDETRIRIVRHVVALARDFGCSTVLEGIEDAATALAAADYGIDLLQGFHFGRPGEASSWQAA